MTLEEIIAAIQALETLIPAVISCVNAIHPPTTSAPTRAVAALNMTSGALTAAGMVAGTVEALKPTIQAAIASAVSPSATQAVQSAIQPETAVVPVVLRATSPN
jgi:hypothetical protein